MSSSMATPCPELARFIAAAETVLVDKSAQLRLAWCCVMAGGHLLIEDLPGMGKTTMVKLMARLLALPWKRVQCTSDMLPADITGGSVYNDSAKTFEFHPGPLFTNLVMADELNRASPKSQSAFLQAMEEQAITVDGVTRKLPDPYVVIATQNSLDSAGTNPLPESQLDRFMMAISLGLPARAGEKELLMESGRAARIDTLDPVCSPAEMAGIRAAVAAVSVSDKVADYILDLATWLRSRAFGFSTRTAIALTAAARSWAYAHGRDYVMPGDVQAVAKAVLAHRLNPKGTATLEGSQALIEGAIKAVEVH